MGQIGYVWQIFKPIMKPIHFSWSVSTGKLGITKQLNTSMYMYIKTLTSLKKINF